MVRGGALLNKMELDVKAKEEAISCLDILISTGFHEIINNFIKSLDLSCTSF